MGRGIAYPRQIGSLDDVSRIARTVVENFRVTADFLNGYVPTYEAGSTDLILPSDLSVVGDINHAGEIIHTGGRNFCHVYDSVGSQSLTATSWNTINLDTQDGTSSTVNFTMDFANDAVDINTKGIYIAIAEVTFQTNESGFLRLMGNGTEEYSRDGFENTTTAEITAFLDIATAAQVTFECYPNTSANTTSSPSSAAVFLKIAKLGGYE